MDVPVPDPAELQLAAEATTEGLLADASGTARSLSAAVGELQVPAEVSTAAAGLLAALPTPPAELKAQVAEALTVLTQGLPPDVVALLQNPPPELLVAAQPAGAGVLVAWLLALRRGRQWWAEELPLRYDGLWIEAYWQRRPLRLAKRFAEVAFRGGIFNLSTELDKALGKEDEMMPQRAVEAKDLITDLGPAFVKIVQVWASRPDILPEPYQKEFEKLLEQVRPFGKEEALETLSRNLGGERQLSKTFDDMSVFEEPVAAASVGQVYRARVQGRDVAVKVQRPDVRETVTLDLYVIRRLAGLGSLLPIERYSRSFKSLRELIDRAAPPFIEELDYENEAQNQQLFAESISNCDLVADAVAVPDVILASREVLVQEWLPGKKLTEPGAAQEQAEKVVKILGSAYMVQLLETGLLHGDPHPGNFVLMPSGKLGILDYGLMTRISPEKRVAFIEYIMHVQAKMYDECLQDLINLEFFPPGIADDKEAREVIVPGLASTLEILFEQSDVRVQQEKFRKQRDELKESGRLEVLQKKLQGIAKKYGSFRLPGYATLVIRALATIEGVGLRTDAKFSIISECFPYVARRLLTDDSLRIREALRAYLYKGRQRIAVKRVDDLATGFKTFTNLMKGSRSEAAVAGAPRPAEAVLDESTKVKIDMASRDIAAVIFSPSGNFLQELLIDEGVAAVDALSRAAIVQVIRSLGPLAIPITGPLSVLVGAGAGTESRILAREDKEALLLIRRIIQLVQGSDKDAPDDVEVDAPAASGGGDLLPRLQQLQPLAEGLLPTITPGAAAFARRFAQQLARRALLRLSDDIERQAGLRKTAAVAATS